MINLPACEPIAAYDEITQNEWLALRKNGIGGSDAAGCMEMSKYSSPLTVVMEKTGRMTPKDLDDNEFVHTGKILEPFIRREVVAPYVKEKLGMEVMVYDPAHMYRSKLYPWMLINADGFIETLTGERKLVGLEVKTGSSYVLKEWGGVDGDEVPDAYYCQVQHYMIGTGLDEWWVFGLIGNQRLLRKVIKNVAFCEQMIQKEREIWDIIQENNILKFPLPSGTDADMDALLEMSTPQRDGIKPLPQSAEEDVKRYLDLKVEISDINEVLEKIKQRLLFTLGDVKFGETENYRLNFSRYTTTSLDKKALMKDHPGIVDPYIKTSETGRLNIKGR